MRSTCPVFAVLLYRFRYKRSYSAKTYLSLVPVVIGVGLVTYGDYYFTRTGFLLTLLGVVLAAVKVMNAPDPWSPLHRSSAAAWCLQDSRDWGNEPSQLT